MSDICETTGHKYSPRYQRLYDIPKVASNDIDFPPILVIIFIVSSMIGAIASSATTMWSVLIPSIFLCLSILIYYYSRFPKKYIYDICSRCGNTIDGSK